VWVSALSVVTAGWLFVYVFGALPTRGVSVLVVRLCRGALLVFFYGSARLLLVFVFWLFFYVLGLVGRGFESGSLPLGGFGRRGRCFALIGAALS
jgi:hypothetical protein